MGMFDQLRCQYPLPNPAHQNLDFQTKDFDCMFHNYVISEEGRLLLEDSLGTELVEEQETKSVINGNFHGEVNFYTFLEASSGKREDGEWVEYEARFENGQLKEIKRIENLEPLDYSS